MSGQKRNWDLVWLHICQHFNRGSSLFSETRRYLDVSLSPLRGGLGSPGALPCHVCSSEAAAEHSNFLRIHRRGNSLAAGFLFLNSQFLVFSPDSLYLSRLSGKVAGLPCDGKQEVSGLLEP